MTQSHEVQVTGYHIELTYEFLGNGVFIEVEASLGDSHGNEIGRVETDYSDFASNLPLALVKTYLLSRKIDSGKLQPAVNL